MVNISVMSTACVDFINKTSSVGVICTGKTAVRCRPTGGGKNLYLQHVALSSKQSTKGLRFLTFTVTPNEEIIATQNRSFRLALLNTEECSHESKAKERSSLTEWLKADHDYGTLDTEDPLAVDESCTETCDRNEKVESISLKWKVNNQSGIQLSNRGDARKHGSDNDPDRGDKQKAVGDDTEHRKERLQVRVHGYYDNTQRVGHGRKKTVDGNGDDGSNSDDESHVNIIPGHYVENPYVNVKTYSKRGSQVENEDLEMISVSPEAIDEVCFPDIEVEAVSQCLQNDAEMTGSSSNIKDAEAPVTVKAKPPQVQEEERPPMRTKSGVPKVDRLINEKFLKLDEMKIQRILKLENSGAVLHAYRCKQGNCIQLEGNSCVLIKLLVHHLRKHQEVQKCHQCQFIDALLSLHSVNCGFEDCHIPFCLEAKKLIHSLTENIDNTWTEQQKQLWWNSGIVLCSATQTIVKGRTLTEGADYFIMYDKPIGGGAHGRVSRAWYYDPKRSIQADIAIKKVHFKSQYHEDKFCEEARMVENLLDNHPYIVRTFAMVKFSKQKLGLVFMERCEANLLEFIIGFKERFNTSGLPMGHAMYLFKQIVSAVRDLHEKGFIHKDLKVQVITSVPWSSQRIDEVTSKKLLSRVFQSRNILLTNNFQRIKLADFDTIMKLEDEVTAAGLPVMGTPGYTAPEVIRRHPHGRPADVFSVGMTFLELLNGEQFNCSDKDRQKQVQEICKEDEALGNLIGQCFADNPNERPTAKQIENHPSIPKYLQTHPILDPHMVCKQLRKLNPPERANHETVANNAAAFAKAHELKNMINEDIERMMDELPKEL